MNEERMARLAYELPRMKGELGMGQWFAIIVDAPRNPWEPEMRAPRTKEELVESCGTVCCIAGETVRMGLKNGDLEPIGTVNSGLFYSDNAAKYLDLTNEQAKHLFHLVWWPTHFNIAYQNAAFGNDQTSMKRIASEVVSFYANKWRQPS